MTGYPELELYIDGRWKRADGQAVLNPADETVLGTVPSATIADLDDAIAAAERGFKIWRKTSPAKRTQIILKAASLIRERVNEMAVGVAIVALNPPSQLKADILKGATVCILLTAVLAAINYAGSARAFWIGFALFGWFYFVVAFTAALPSGR